MKSSIVRFFIVALFAVGSFAAHSTSPIQSSNGTASFGPHQGPQIPIPICPGCGHGGNDPN